MYEPFQTAISDVLQRCTMLCTVDLSTLPLTAQAVKDLTAHKTLESVDVSETGIREDAVRGLLAMPALTRLMVFRCQIPRRVKYEMEAVNKQLCVTGTVHE